MARAQFVMSFLKQENKQLKDKQVLMELELLKAKRQESKGKAVMTPNESKHGENQSTKTRPKQ